MKEQKFSTLYYVIAMLKKYNIQDVISSPGAQNARFNSLVQYDDDFNCVSVVDERSAGYFAIGIANEKKMPVVITCTGATASRNYMSALTEAYYRKIPIIALTFFNPVTSAFTLSPQYVDRSITQNDIKVLSVTLPQCSSEQNIDDCILYLNAALTTAMLKKMPVHINCPASNDFEKGNISLSENIWKSDYYTSTDESLTEDFINKKTAIFIGEHREFSQDEINAVSSFAKSWNIPVICDHTSNYTGENKILISKIASMLRVHQQKPDIIIDIGNLSGEYTSQAIFKDTQIWRISEDGTYRTRYGQPLKKFFCLKEVDFFKNLINTKNSLKNNYYQYLKDLTDKLKIPKLPLCNTYVCKCLSENLPKNSSLHVSILNSLRNLNFFDMDNSINITCNVGGFGIDGAVSTLVGQSLCNPNKKYFGLIGDLAFFYDMNAIGHRDIKNNLRIIVLNNNGGFEFRPKKGIIEQIMHDDTGVLIAASNHYKGGAKLWAKSCGFEYISASTQEDFDNLIKDFCNKDFDKPILFEVFVLLKDEQDGLYAMQMNNRNKLEEGLINCYKVVAKGRL